MANTALVDRVTNLAAAITQDSIDQLVSNPKWGTLNFEGARENLKLIFSLAGHLQSLPVEIVPDGPVTNFIQSLEQSSESIKLMREFSLEGSGNPTQSRDNIVARLKENAEQLLNVTQGWIAFLAYQKGDVQRNIEALNATVGQAKDIIAKAQTYANTSKQELDGIISAAREASASVGVAHFTSDFAGQAEALDRDAGTWLKWTAALAVATMVGAVLSFLLPIPSGASNAVVIQFMTSKLVLLGVLFGATAWCGRIYRALKHQAAVNSHRANSLKSFQAFVKATADEGTRNAVLLETTRSIFAIASSGYLEGNDGPGDTGSKVLEIVKGATGGGGKP